MNYRKHEIAHWNQGKRCKGSRKAALRELTEREIDLQLAEQDENFRYRHVSKGTPNHVARLEHRVDWYEHAIVFYERIKCNSYSNYLRSSLEKAKKALADLKGKQS